MMHPVRLLATFVILSGTSFAAWPAAHPFEPANPHTLTVEVGTSGFNNVRWTSFPVSFVYHNGVTNLATIPNVETGSNPRQACNNGATSWTAVSSLTFVDSGTTSFTTTSNNGVNLVTFASTATNNATTAGALAVCLYFYNPANFVITDADIIFNSTELFSTLGTANRSDIESVAAHEFGHAFGLNHSAVSCATMFATIPSGSTFNRRLSLDDVAGINHVYPTLAHFNSVGTITGTITNGGVPVQGAHVVARSLVTGVTVTGTLSRTNYTNTPPNPTTGFYELTNLEGGPYLIYAEPLDGPAEDGHIVTSFWTSPKDTNFKTTFFGGNSNPTIVRVQPLLTTPNINIAVGTGPALLNLNLTGIAGGPGGPFQAFPSGFELTQGTSSHIAVGGLLVQSTPSSAFSVPGPGVTFGPTATSQGTFIGFPETWKIFPITLSNQTPPGPRDIVMSANGETVIHSGAIDVRETTPAVSRVVSYGTGCTGSNGPFSLVSVGGLPAIPNAAFGLQAIGTSAGGSCAFVFSYLPDFVDLGQGCIQWVNTSNLRLVVPLVTFVVPSNTPSTIRGFPIPNIPSLAGTQVYCQAVASDPGAPLGFITSNGIQFTVR